MGSTQGFYLCILRGIIQASKNTLFYIYEISVINVNYQLVIFTISAYFFYRDVVKFVQNIDNVLVTYVYSSISESCFIVYFLYVLPSAATNDRLSF